MHNDELEDYKNDLTFGDEDWSSVPAGNGESFFPFATLQDAKIKNNQGKIKENHQPGRHSSKDVDDDEDLPDFVFEHDLEDGGFFELKESSPFEGELFNMTLEEGLEDVGDDDLLTEGDVLDEGENISDNFTAEEPFPDEEEFFERKSRDVNPLRARFSEVSTDKSYKSALEQQTIRPKFTSSSPVVGNSPDFFWNSDAKEPWKNFSEQQHQQRLWNTSTDDIVMNTKKNSSKDINKNTIGAKPPVPPSLARLLEQHQHQQRQLPPASTVLSVAALEARLKQVNLEGNSKTDDEVPPGFHTPNSSTILPGGAGVPPSNSRSMPPYPYPAPGYPYPIPPQYQQYHQYHQHQHQYHQHVHQHQQHVHQHQQHVHQQHQQHQHQQHQQNQHQHQHQQYPHPHHFYQYHQHQHQHQHQHMHQHHVHQHQQHVHQHQQQQQQQQHVHQHQQQQQQHVHQHQQQQHVHQHQQHVHQHQHQIPSLSQLLTPSQYEEVSKLPPQDQRAYLQQLFVTLMQQRAQEQQQRQSETELQQAPPPVRHQEQQNQEIEAEQPQKQQQVEVLKKSPPSSSVDSPPQQQQVDPTSDDRSGTPTRRKRWKVDKELMLAEDIDGIIRLQEFQLQSDNPFLEDYYYLNLMKRLNPKVVSGELLFRHRPISECLKPAGTGKKRVGKDPLLEGSLGKVSVSSSRAPRTIVELIHVEERKDDEKIDNKDSASTTGNIDDVDDVNIGAKNARALVARTDGLSSLARTILLSIETAISAVLEIEDLDLILSSLGNDNDTRFNKQSISEKRLEKTNLLFQTLQISQPNLDQNNVPLPPSSQMDGFYSPKDEFFVRLLSIGKGTKMLTRAIPLLFPQFSSLAISIINAILRNMHVIVLFPTGEEEVTRLKNVFKVVVKALNTLTTPQFLSCFQSMLTTQSSTPYLRRRFIRTIKTKIGIFVFTSLMKKGYDISDQIRQLNQHRQVQPQLLQQIEELQRVYVSWNHIYTNFTEQLMGKLSSLLTTAVSSAEFTNSAPSDQIWQFFVYFSLCATPQLKEEIFNELNPIIAAVEETSDIKTLLQALGQNHSSVRTNNN